MTATTHDPPGTRPTRDVGARTMTDDELRTRPTDDGAVAPPRWRRRRVVLLVAAVAVAAASGAVATRVLDDSTADDIAAVVDASDAVTFELAGEIGELRVVSSDEERRTVVLGDGVSEVDDDEAYQLWAVSSPDAAPASLGTFRTDGHGVVEAVLDDVRVDPGARLLVTVERSGGADAPSAPWVAATDEQRR